MASYYTCKDGDELDLICRDFYGYSRGSVEAVLSDEKNREVAQNLPILSTGDVIYLPDLAPQARGATTTNLWN